MIDDTKTATGPHLDCLVRLTPFKQRIVDALRGRGDVDYHTLAYQLWPPATHARAWHYATKGGPHGWAMSLGKALREMERAGIVRQWLGTGDMPTRTVRLKVATDFERVA